MHAVVEDPRLVIRRAQDADISDVMNITREAFAVYAANLGLPGKVQALSETEKDVAQDIREKLVLIGLLDGVPIGSVRGDVVGQAGYISRFGTLPSAPKCNMGAALLAQAEDWMRGEGALVSALHTSTKMSKLIRFYYTAGYYVHSTTTHKGYIRGLLIHELADGAEKADLGPVMGR